MSDFAYSLNGAAPLVKKYQVDATVANVGVPLIIDTAGEAGLNAGTTTGAIDFAGMAIDTITYTTTQGTGGDSAERKVGVIIQPDAVWRVLLSDGAAEGTQLTLYDVTTASAGGTAVTTGDDWNTSGTDYDEGVVWGFDGANAGQIRRITSADTTSATVTIPFDNATVVGDNFMRAPYWPHATTTLQFTTNLWQADVSVDVAVGGEWVVVDWELYDIGRDGRTKSHVHIMSRDHVLASRPT